MYLKKTVFARILKDVAVRIQDDHSGKVLDNLDDLLSIPGINSCSAHLMLQYVFNQLNMSLCDNWFTVSFISCNSLNLFFFQSIAVDTNVVIWAHVLDWIPHNMKDVEEVQKLLEQMLPEAFFEHVHYTLGSLSQVIQGGFPQEDCMDSVHWICPEMTAVFIVMLELIKNFKGTLDLDFKQN